MNLKTIKNLFVALFLTILCFGTSCAKQPLSSASQRQELEKSGEDSKAVLHPRTETTMNIQDFNSFYADFSCAVENSDWKQLAKLTSFPLLFRGELDDEGEVRVDEKTFFKIIAPFFEEKVYLEINDDLIPSTYRAIVEKPTEKPRIENKSRAELHGFQFAFTNGKWKLKQITTYLHIIEQIKEQQ